MLCIMAGEFNLRGVFGGISSKLLADFETSAHIHHTGGRGTTRESSIAAFMRDYLPRRYAVGFGEVVHWSNQHSRQVDTLIYDAERCPRLLARDDYSVYPLESVYGAIEVKSDLTSGELEKAFENIASVKRMVEPGGITIGGPGFAVGCARPIPFGAIVAYKASRSIEAIEKQVAALVAAAPDRIDLPDCIAVLGEGVISLPTPIRDEINRIDPQLLRRGYETRRTGRHTLLRFYLTTLRELNTIQLERLDLSRYLNMPERLDGHVVRQRTLVHNKSGKPVGTRRISAAGIRKIIAYCEKEGPVPYVEFMRRALDGIPLPDDGKRYDGHMVYVYNPRNAVLLPPELDPAHPDRPRFAQCQLQIDECNYEVDLLALDPDSDFEEADEALGEMFSDATLARLR